MELTAETRAIFVPSDPPRDGVLALWGDGAGPTPVELVLPRGKAFRRTKVDAHVVPLAEAIPLLLSAPDDAGPAIAAWSAAVGAALTLIARGRVLPTATSGGADAWRVGPLDGADETLVRELAAALPPEAHALPLSGLKRVRLHSPETLVRALWDATADVLVRTPAARVVAGGPAFAAPEPTLLNAADVEWLAAQQPTGAHLQLRVEIREEEPEQYTFAGVLALRSAIDPSLVVDAETLWDAPEAVLSRLGDQVEAQLLIALRRGARVWAPLGRALEAAAPAELILTDDELVELLDTGSAALSAAGVEVLWPKGMFSEGLRAKASATPAPGSEAAAAFRMTDLLKFRWQLSLGGETLTEAEITALAEAKRPMIRLRGQWVRVDPGMLAKLRRRSTRTLNAAEALAAALTGSLEVDGEQLDFAPPPAVSGLLDRIRHSPSSAVEVPPDLQATLRPYQRTGLGWLARMTELGLGGILADDMGLGKTIQLIALHLHRRSLGAGPTLVLCPTSLLGNWEREFARFAPSVPVRRFHGGRRHLDEVAPDEVVLATYGVLRRDREALAEVGWGLLAADEAQHVKNPLSITAKELRRIPGAARVALTGTPMENRLTELWSIVDWTTPGLLGTLEHFRRTIARPVERNRDRESTERLAATVRPFLLRRRKTDPDIAPELPRKTETDRFVPLTTEQATLYEAVVRENLAVIRESKGVQRRGQVLKLLTELKQICNHPAQYLKQAGPLTGRSGKLAAFEELLDVILDEGDSVLVFSQYVQLCKLLQARLGERGLPVELLSGATSVRRREEMVQRFQSGDIPVFLLSLKAGGVGLNLTRATHVIHYDRWWNPAVEDQATDRAYRIGQDRPVQVHRLIAEGTLEDRIATVLEGKRGLADAVVGAGEDWITELSDEQLTDLVRLGEAS
ncbi:DEAD/DEAH box helicase [Amycolatopsis acidiphila]|uniref:DEAD/DEAH box helicase n=1 Tax=Amycolatopsis acidiphila TaxID=715473 RepID=A0A558AEV9_9PSEU|nr:DEAD/DEAH box helicase [Amycolatopsis acidiphila]TVT22798.1 DEAD/DEAH box helicase [Amycolatopsis acidiphila]UIJ58189.1 DEAD/DEAH box helicase [Amycolatopsis acidiphila]